MVAVLYTPTSLPRPLAPAELAALQVRFDARRWYADYEAVAALLGGETDVLACANSYHVTALASAADFDDTAVNDSVMPVLAELTGMSWEGDDAPRGPVLIIIT